MSNSFRSLFFLILKMLFLLKLSAPFRNSLSSRRNTLLSFRSSLNSPAEFSSSASSIAGREKRSMSSSARGLFFGSALILGSNSRAMASTVSAASSAVNVPVRSDQLSDTQFRQSIVLKRPSDSREYRALRLSNMLRVLLISDKTSNRAAAALDVHVGSFSDPADIPGIAHFAEHMCFLGTSKYPEENDFR